jgi:outer membrane immunogenic protein
MRKLVILLASCVAMPALAADLPAKAPARPAAVADWTGFYVGIHGGYGWGSIKPDDFDIAAFSDDAFGNPEPKGWVFGGHVGYLWQYGRFVGGLEVDYSAADLKETQTSPLENGFVGELPATRQFALASKIDALASARGRAGFLLSDNLLAYGTAGVAWGHAKVSVTQTICIVKTSVCNSDSLSAAENNFGWVAGGGIEYRLTQNLLLRGEYLHYDFGSVGYAFQPLVTINAKTTVDVARGGLSLKF